MSILLQERTFLTRVIGQKWEINSLVTNMLELILYVKFYIPNYFQKWRPVILFVMLTLYGNDFSGLILQITRGI